MNSLSEMLWFAWPWVGLGGGIALLIMLLFTDVLRSDLNRSRWRDPVWLSWAVAFVYLPHVCEEYGMHIANGQYALITQFREMGVDAMFGGIPLIFFPLVNIIMTWIALPIAALMSKKNPVIGLSGMGFILINGLTHLASCIRGGISPMSSPGSVTGIFFFLPLFIWICVVQKREKILPEKGIGIAIASGIIGHVLLFVLYFINKVAGHVVACIFIPVVAFSPMIIAWLLCRALSVKKAVT